jgi:hypothetical protein
MNRDHFVEIINNHGVDHETVTETTIDKQTKWSVYKSKVVKQISTGKLFVANWIDGASGYTCSEHDPWFLTEVEFPQTDTSEYCRVPKGIEIVG